MSLPYFTNRSLSQLRHEIGRNKSRYSAPESWLSDAVLGPGWHRDSGISVTTLPQLVSTKPTDDCENARLVHSALRTLTPAQAMDERLWSHLAHVRYWKYMRERWGDASIASRYFFKNRGISGLTLHGIARLWWFGHVTYEPHRSNPYELTAVLLKYQDTQTSLLQRSIGKSPIVRTAVLEYLDRRSSEVAETGASVRIQALLRDLNLAGGVRLIDALNRKLIVEILDQSLKSPLVTHR